MNPTKRQRIMDVLKTLLEDIQQRNGYNTNMGLDCKPWRMIPYDVEDLEAITFRDADADISRTFPRKLDTHDALIDIEGKIAAGGLTAEKMRAAIADILNAVSKNPQFIVEGSYLAIGTVPIHNTILIDQNDRIIGGCKVTIKVTYTTPDWEL
jgi:hypothetical protein